MSTSNTDSSLVARVLLEDDREAFGELVARHQSAVRGFLRHLCRGDAATADDLAQETFLLAHRTLARFETAGRFDTWLLGLAFNLQRNASRKQRRREFEAVPEELPEEGPTPAETFAQKQDVAAALAQLSNEEQLAIHACYHQDLSHPEAAALLEMPLGTLKSHLTRGKNKLREILSHWSLHS